MRELKANINSILNSSFIDGPGNRMVIFFQGCQFDCIYCHNPLTIGLCNKCGDCVDNCPTQSLKLTGKELIHKEVSCVCCDICIKSCKQNSSPFYEQYTVSQLIKEVKKCADFISGVTLSGGEVLLQEKFVVSFIEGLKSDYELNHLTVFIDSNGGVPIKSVQKVAKFADGFLIDLKAALNTSHIKITGQPVENTLNTINYLSSLEKLSELRTVVVKGVNDSEQEKEQYLKIYSSLTSETKIYLLKMRKHGIRDKYSYLEEATDSEMLQMIRYYASKGVKVNVL
ncbi:MAG: YjjW family glycine radical enzyme activase [Bacteroidales bacterium]|nr:YjjW family glycine radical enzyme activase [Bacteroidales bacterium]